jgi:hypothetical protein
VIALTSHESVTAVMSVTPDSSSSARHPLRSKPLRPDKRPIGHNPDPIVTAATARRIPSSVTQHRKLPMHLHAQRNFILQ